MDKLVRMALPIYFSIELLVDESLYGIMLCGPLVVVMFNSYQYICVYYVLEGNLVLDECVLMMITLCENYA